MPRTNHKMVYDSLNQRIILFGGLGNDFSDSYNDTWTFDCLNDNWTELSESSEANSTSGFELFLVTSVVFALSFVKLWKKFD
ncbi:MAG: kelch repeat-containing protein [Candidatus Hodarchaeota archaeon]